MIQQRLAGRATIPIYIAMKHEAQEFATFGDYRRAIIDLAIACETFIRQSVLDTLPADIRANIWKFIEEGNIDQYISNFLPSLLGPAAATQYRKTLKDELSSLFSKRNDIMHRGVSTDATSDNCRRFVAVFDALLELVPQGMVEARTPSPPI